MSDRPLSDLLPADRIAAALPRPGTWRPLPPAADRAAWGRVPAAPRARLERWTDERLAGAWPPLPPDGFEAFGARGDRVHHEGPHFARRSRMAAAVVRTLLAGPGAATDQLIEGVRELCGEPTWCVPAHERSTGPGGIPAPDPDRPTLDLFAAETAGLLAFTSLLVGDELPPEERGTIEAEVRHRVLVPFRERDWPWLGLRGEPLNNWTPWILSNVLPATLILDDDPGTQASGVARAVAALDRYLASVPADGGCDEGIHYWWRAAASFFECLEHLASATGEDGAFRLPVVASMARYPVAAHLGGEWYVNFADGRPLLRAAEPGLLYRYGVRTGDAEVRAQAAAMPPATDLDAPDHSLARLVTPLIDDSWHQARHAPPAAPLPRQTWLPDTQVLTAREHAGDSGGLFLAAKAGHNDESHNHNDVGSFIVGVNARPVVIDLGVGTYDKSTFGPDRYRIWTMRSAWHNLPLIDGHEQAAGRHHTAADVCTRLSATVATLTLDLAGAWPQEAGVRSWRRELTLARGAKPATLTVRDDWHLAEPPGDLALHLVTTGPVAVDQAAGTLLLGPEGHRLAVRFDAAGYRAETEERSVTDAKLRAVWGPSVHRVRLVAKRPEASGATALTFQAARNAP
ncbi:heparinase II/III family protein [Streptomyces sp. PT12]|uniref:heparinase II/III domain-containing protein n=1 Tax=Streptomyces sp. PT12 TaxID=1510197 RepID=UPI000DE47953|nr:heparinase II/III family protein [Streptomyces sp. PT12]RBM23332.1 heparinase [Streptomyces sp. PT12]